MSLSKKAASISTDLRSGCSALATTPAPSRLGEKACSTARLEPCSPRARNLVLRAISWIWLPTLRNSAIQSAPIWLAYRPRSPTELAILTVNRKGLFSAVLGISSQTFSSLRQIGNRPSSCLAPRITSAKGLGAVGSTGGRGGGLGCGGAGSTRHGGSGGRSGGGRRGGGSGRCGGLGRRRGGSTLTGGGTGAQQHHGRGDGGQAQATLGGQGRRNTHSDHPWTVLNRARAGLAQSGTPAGAG